MTTDPLPAASHDRVQDPAPSLAATPEYLTAEQVAAMLQLSAKSIYRLVKDDATLPCLKLGGSVRFPRERLLKWLRDREQGQSRMRRQALPARNGATAKEPASG